MSIALVVVKELIGAMKMLKIKDNVDLKELEKFGFIKSEYQGFDAYIRYNPLVGKVQKEKTK